MYNYIYTFIYIYIYIYIIIHYSHVPFTESRRHTVVKDYTLVASLIHM